ncbi:hypothetical protein N7532_003796 [Penicillium argentinense]|uniref:Inner kinetochore subunit AME1 domain-containing protein n=1 Tax=Penicillium argentinense TaxID=1131581 RepID=A0A9W9FNN5_9EURO|nr:uncharacterized protein N7532_003796 [Penicillium argentinense]KAJ5103267.1 hypothetical protein N7532_003796 [Penicillium argentinense]
MHNEQADVENSAVNGTEAEAPTSAKQAQTTTTTPNRARTSGSKSLVTDSQSTAGLPRNIERQEKQQQTGPPTAESSTMTNNDESPEIGKQTRPRLSRKGGNQSTSADDREINSGRSQLPNAEQAIPEPARETQYMPEDAPSGGSAKVKRKGARISPAKRPTNTETESRPQSPIESAPTTGKSSAAGARRGRKPTKKAEIQAAPEPEARAEPAEIEESGSRRGKAGRKATKTAEHKSAAASKPTASQTEPEPAPQPLVEEPSPAAEPEISKNRRGRPGKKAKVGSEPQRPADSHSDPQPESPPEPEPEVEEPAHVLEQETLPRSSNKRHDKPGNKSKRAPRPEEAPPEEHTEAEAPQETQRKPREPRGETVPVTVHRLANAAALGGTYASVDDSGDEREGSPDEISTRQKTKIPSRGGVNPADVLGQICRETLEKTLATLKTGIENESNPTRRAEWSRKRKAVESFGMELDGRLLDLSEMLDSNFVLGVQLKKAKRDMMDLRSHLHQVRREREAIALQMDRVRSKHMEEEQETTARSTINNSIHSLELALDRSQHRASSSAETSSTELEFLLRTVAEEVSCRAPGAQGGLLHQIRSLNAQLEATARQLERQ